MYQLSLSDIDLIKSDISRQRVSYSHLLDDLIDHVCCDVEDEMNSGLPFEKAYKKVRGRVGMNRYKKIQEETLILIDKNYKSMKQFMKVFGVLSPALISLAALFKIQHWPGASIMLVLGFFFLCFFFLPSSVYVLYTENKGNKRHLLLHLSGLFSSVIFLVGILFKVQHWPGASLLLTVGLISIALIFIPSLVAARISDDKGKKSVYLVGFFAALFYIAGFLFKLMHWPGASVATLVGLILFVVIFLPAYTYAHFKDSEHVQTRFIFLSVASMLAVLFLSMMTLTVSKNIFIDYVIAEDNIDNVLQDLNHKNARLAKSISLENANYESINRIQKNADDIVSWINSLKRDLVIAVDSENSEALSGDKIECEDILGKDNFNVPAEILISNEKGQELRVKLEGYKELLLSSSNNPEYVSNINMLLNVSVPDRSDGLILTWESFTFEHRSMMSVLSTLTMLQVQVKLAEKEMLGLLANDQADTEQTLIAEENSTF